MAKKTAELIYGEFEFHLMKADEIDPILELLVDGYDPSVDSITRKRLDVYGICKRNELETMAEVNAYAAERVKNKLKGVPADYKDLIDDREQVEELLGKAKCRVRLENYGDNETHKLVGILWRAVEARFDALSLEEFVELEITSAVRGRGMPVTFEDGIPTTEPDGVSERAKELMELIAEFEDENDRTTPVFGRNQGQRPWGLMTLADGVRIQISLPDTFKFEEEDAE